MCICRTKYLYIYCMYNPFFVLVVLYIVLLYKSSEIENTLTVREKQIYLSNPLAHFSQCYT